VETNVKSSSFVSSCKDIQKGLFGKKMEFDEA